LELFAPAFPNTVWQPTEYVPSTQAESEQDAFLKYGKIGTQHENGSLATLDHNLKQFSNVLPAKALDLTQTSSFSALPHSVDWIHAGNVVHVAPYPSATVGFFELGNRLLRNDDHKGRLTLYGPFKRHGKFVSPSDEEFDQYIGKKNELFGLGNVEFQLTSL
jgi:hypothetical protein